MTSKSRNPQEPIGRDFLYEGTEQKKTHVDRYFMNQARIGILYSFRWRDTVEGFDYWATVYRKLEEMLDRGDDK